MKRWREQEKRQPRSQSHFPREEVSLVLDVDLLPQYESVIRCTVEREILQVTRSKGKTTTFFWICSVKLCVQASKWKLSLWFLWLNILFCFIPQFYYINFRCLSVFLSLVFEFHHKQRQSITVQSDSRSKARVISPLRKWPRGRGWKNGRSTSYKQPRL